jgi:hypothetical protein
MMLLLPPDVGLNVPFLKLRIGTRLQPINQEADREPGAHLAFPLRSGTRSRPVAQAADATFTLVSIPENPQVAPGRNRSARPPTARSGSVQNLSHI